MTTGCHTHIDSGQSSRVLPQYALSKPGLRFSTLSASLGSATGGNKFVHTCHVNEGFNKDFLCTFQDFFFFFFLLY